MQSFFQFWNAYLNKNIFNNELEPALIKVYPFKDEEHYAQFDENFEPFVIAINKDILQEDATEEDYIFYITVLLHEMIHQYMFENELDIEDDDVHGGIFEEEAKRHGLEQGGYKLNDETHNLIKNYLKNYNTIKDYPF